SGCRGRLLHLGAAGPGVQHAQMASGSRRGRTGRLPRRHRRHSRPQPPEHHHTVHAAGHPERLLGDDLRPCPLGLPAGAGRPQHDHAEYRHHGRRSLPADRHRLSDDLADPARQQSRRNCLPHHVWPAGRVASGSPAALSSHPGRQPEPGRMTDPAPPPFTIARYCLAGNARLRPDKTAMILVGAESEFRMTFGEVDLAVRRLAAGLQSLGLPPGSRIMIRMANDADYALTYFATMAAGYVALPSSAQLTAAEAAFLLENSGAAAVAASAELARDLVPPPGVQLIDPTMLQRLKLFEPLADYADTAADGPAYLVYTSGTTGKPKGVLHAHRAAWGRRPMHQGWLGLQESDVVLHAGAFNWTYTLGVGLVDPWAV